MRQRQFKKTLDLVSMGQLTSSKYSSLIQRCKVKLLQAELRFQDVIRPFSMNKHPMEHNEKILHKSKWHGGKNISRTQ